MKRSNQVLLILAIVGLLLGSMAPVGAKAAGQTGIPWIAYIAGFTVGKSTIEQMERRFGPALHYMGGHPHGGREWWSKRPDVAVNADGFDYDANGRLIDQLWLGRATPPWRGAGYARALRGPMTFAGVVRLGLTRRQVLELLKKKVPVPSNVAPPDCCGESSGTKGIGQLTDLKWSMRGHFVYRHHAGNQSDVYTHWTAQLHFDNYRLESIDVECE